MDEVEHKEPIKNSSLSIEDPVSCSESERCHSSNVPPAMLSLKDWVTKQRCLMEQPPISESFTLALKLTEAVMELHGIDIPSASSLPRPSVFSASYPIASSVVSPKYFLVDHSIKDSIWISENGQSVKLVQPSESSKNPIEWKSQQDYKAHIYQQYLDQLSGIEISLYPVEMVEESLDPRNASYDALTSRMVERSLKAESWALGVLFLLILRCDYLQIPLEILVNHKDYTSFFCLNYSNEEATHPLVKGLFQRIFQTNPTKRASIEEIRQYILVILTSEGESKQQQKHYDEKIERIIGSDIKSQIADIHLTLNRFSSTNFTLELASETLPTEEYVHMRETLKDLIRARPGFKETTILLAKVYAFRGNKKAAMHSLNRYLEIVKFIPEKGRFGFDLGLIYQYIGDYNSAIDYFEQCWEDNRVKKAELHFRIGVVNLLQKSYSLAVKSFQDCLKLVNPKNVCVMRHLALALMRDDRMLVATEMMQEIMYLDERYAETYREYKIQMFTQQIKHLSVITRTDDYSFENNMYYGKALQGGEKYEEAIEQYQKSLDKMPENDNLGSFIGLIECEVSQGNFSSAEKKLIKLEQILNSSNVQLGVDINKRAYLAIARIYRGIHASSYFPNAIRAYFKATTFLERTNFLEQRKIIAEILGYLKLNFDPQLFSHLVERQQSQRRQDSQQKRRRRNFLKENKIEVSKDVDIQVNRLKISLQEMLLLVHREIQHDSYVGIPINSSEVKFDNFTMSKMADVLQQLACYFLDSDDFEAALFAFQFARMTSPKNPMIIFDLIATTFAKQLSEVRENLDLLEEGNEVDVTESEELAELEQRKEVIAKQFFPVWQKFLNVENQIPLLSGELVDESESNQESTIMTQLETLIDGLSYDKPAKVDKLILNQSFNPFLYELRDIHKEKVETINQIQKEENKQLQIILQVKCLSNMTLFLSKNNPILNEIFSNLKLRLKVNHGNNFSEGVSAQIQYIFQSNPKIHEKVNQYLLFSPLNPTFIASLPQIYFNNLPVNYTNKQLLCHFKVKLEESFAFRLALRELFIGNFKESIRFFLACLQANPWNEYVGDIFRFIKPKEQFSVFKDKIATCKEINSLNDTFSQFRSIILNQKNYSHPRRSKGSKRIALELIRKTNIGTDNDVLESHEVGYVFCLDRIEHSHIFEAMKSFSSIHPTESLANKFNIHSAFVKSAQFHYQLPQRKLNEEEISIDQIQESIEETERCLKGFLCMESSKISVGFTCQAALILCDIYFVQGEFKKAKEYLDLCKNERSRYCEVELSDQKKNLPLITQLYETLLQIVTASEIVESEMVAAFLLCLELIQDKRNAGMLPLFSECVINRIDHRNCFGFCFFQQVLLHRNLERFQDGWSLIQQKNLNFLPLRLLKCEMFILSGHLSIAEFILQRVLESNDQASCNNEILRNQVELFKGIINLNSNQSDNASLSPLVNYLRFIACKESCPPLGEYSYERKNKEGKEFAVEDTKEEIVDICKEILDEERINNGTQNLPSYETWMAIDSIVSVFKQNNDFEAGEQLWKLILRLRPTKQIKGWLELGLIYSKQGNVIEKDIAFNNSLNSYGSDSISLMELGLVLKSENQFKNAIRAFKRCQQLQENSGYLYRLRGECYQQINPVKYRDRAIQCFNQAIKLDKNDLSSIISLARFYLSQNSESSSKEGLDNQGLIVLADALKDPKNGNNAKFYDSINQLLDSYPSIKEFRINIWIQELSNIPDKRIENYSKMVRLCRYQMKNYEEALVYYEKQISFDRHNMDVLYAYATLCMELGLLQKAEDALKSVLYFIPQKYEANFRLSTIYIQQNQFQKAKHAVELALKYNENHVVGLQNYGYLLMKEKNYKAAFEIFEKCMYYSDGQIIEIFVHLGVIYSKLEMFEESIACFKVGLGRNPDQITANTLKYLKVYLKMQRYEEAKEEFEVFWPKGKVGFQSETSAKKGFYFAEVYRELGMYKEMYQQFNSVMKLKDFKYNILACYRLVASIVASRKNNEIKTFLLREMQDQKNINTHPRLCVLGKIALAWLFISDGDFLQAKKELDSAAAINSKHSTKYFENEMRICLARYELANTQTGLANVGSAKKAQEVFALISEDAIADEAYASVSSIWKGKTRIVDTIEYVLLNAEIQLRMRNYKAAEDILNAKGMSDKFENYIYAEINYLKADIGAGMKTLDSQQILEMLEKHQKHQNHLRSSLEMVRIYLNQGKVDFANETLNKFKNQFNTNFYLMRLLMRSLKMAGKNTAAQEYGLLYRKKFDEDTYAHLDFVEILMNLGDLETAQGVIVQYGFDAFPIPKETYLLFAKLYILKKQYGDAINQIDFYISRDPKDACGYLVLGQAYLMLGQLEKELESYEIGYLKFKILDNAELLERIGNIYVSQRRFKELEVVIEHLNQIKNLEYKLLLRICEWQIEIGDLSVAEDSIRNCLKQKDKDLPTLKLLFVVLLRTGQNVKFEETLGLISARVNLEDFALTMDIAQYYFKNPKCIEETKSKKNNLRCAIFWAKKTEPVQAIKIGEKDLFIARAAYLLKDFEQSKNHFKHTEKRISNNSSIDPILRNQQLQLKALLAIQSSKRLSQIPIIMECFVDIDSSYEALKILVIQCIRENELSQAWEAYHKAVKISRNKKNFITVAEGVSEEDTCEITDSDFSLTVLKAILDFHVIVGSVDVASQSYSEVKLSEAGLKMLEGILKGIEDGVKEEVNVNKSNELAYFIAGKIAVVLGMYEEANEYFKQSLLSHSSHNLGSFDEIPLSVSESLQAQFFEVEALVLKKKSPLSIENVDTAMRVIMNMEINNKIEEFLENNESNKSVTERMITSVSLWLFDLKDGRERAIQVLLNHSQHSHKDKFLLLVAEMQVACDLFKEAKLTLERCIKWNPNCVKAKVRLGLLNGEINAHSKMIDYGEESFTLEQANLRTTEVLLENLYKKKSFNEFDIVYSKYQKAIQSKFVVKTTEIAESATNDLLNIRGIPPSLILLNAKRFKKVGNFEAALLILENGIKKHTRECEFFLLQAKLHEKAYGDYEKSFDILSSTLDFFSQLKQYRIQLRMSHSLIMQGKFKEARSMYEGPTLNVNSAFEEMKFGSSDVRIEGSENKKNQMKELFYNYGICCLAGSDYALAAKSFESAYALDRYSEKIQFMQGYLDMKLLSNTGLNKHNKSSKGIRSIIYLYHHCVDIAPTFLQGALKLSILYRQIGEFKEAECVLNDAMKVFPKHLSITYQLAVLHIAKGCPSQAVLLLKEAIGDYAERAKVSQDKRSGATKRFLEEFYLQQFESEAVIVDKRNMKYFQDSVARQESQRRHFIGLTELNLLLALSIRRCMQGKEAVAFLKECLKEDPMNVEYKFSLAESYNMTSELHAAIQMLIQCIEGSNDNPVKSIVCRFMLADMYDQTKEYVKEIDMLKSCLKIQPEIFEVAVNLGSALVKEKRFNEAIEQFRNAVKMQPDNADSYFNLGNAYIMASRNNGHLAIEAYESCLKLNSKHEQCYMNLAQVLKIAGQFTYAIECYEKCIVINPIRNDGVHEKLMQLYKINSNS